MSKTSAKITEHQPVILSMEVDDDNSFESEYRIQVGQEVKYLKIAPGTFDRDTLSFPIEQMLHLPWKREWNVACMSKDAGSSELRVTFEQQQLVGVKCRWHHRSVDCLALMKVEQLTAMAFKATLLREVRTADSLPQTVIAKIARFEWEIARIEQETKAYQRLEGSGLALQFLAHIHENGRIIGFLLENIDGRPAGSEDIDACKTALTGLHRLGFKHGDVNRYNFLITERGIKLIDFERTEEVVASAALEEEIDSLSTQLIDDSGRGGGFIFSSE